MLCSERSLANYNTEQSDKVWKREDKPIMNRVSKKILHIELHERNSSSNDAGVECERSICSLGTENTWLVLLRSFFVAARLSKYDFIITNEYFSSFGMNLRLLITGCRTKHVTVGLNQSRRLLKTEFSWLDRMINRIFNRSDLYIVHSRREIDLFERIHQIPRGRFYFSMWGYDLPELSSSVFSRWPRKYVCLIGRNNRDFTTFASACDGLDVDGIIITSSHEEVPGTAPNNVYVFRDLPENATLDCIRNAEINLILLRDDNRGAGHITAVASMFIGTAQIASDADVLEDYLIDGVTSISVPLGDALAARRAIERLLQQPAVRRQISENAKAYAEAWLSHKSVSQRICFALSTISKGQVLPTVDPRWLSAYQNLQGQKAVRK